MSHFPPRGFGEAGPRETAPRGLWLPPEQLDQRWDYDPRGNSQAVLLGRLGNYLLGRADDRHVVTIAGSRAGKSRSVLIPNLKRYRGSVVVIDPKGELARETAAIREGWGHNVFVLNPFNVNEWGTNGHNPCEELLQCPPETLTADVAQFADALIIGNTRDPHWTDASKNLITGLLLHTITTNPSILSIPTLRKQLSNTSELADILAAMALNDALGGIISNIGASFAGKFSRSGGHAHPNEEMQSVLSTANAQTRVLDDVTSVFAKHDFSLSSLGGTSEPTTVYLILPATRIATHAKWLRLFIYQLLAALERNGIPHERLPLWLILEEFAALGHLQSVEAAAGYFAGFGVKLWTVLQDLSQLKTHYKNSWETFLGNAGIIQAFGNFDVTTTRYLSELLGNTSIVEEHKNFVTADQRAHGDDGIRRNLRSVALLEPSEITHHFSRASGRQLILTPDERPIYMDKIPSKDMTEDPFWQAHDPNQF